MKTLRFATLALLALITLAQSALQAAPPPEIPVETLFAKPFLAQPQLSSDGRYIAMLQPANNRMNITVIDRVEGKKDCITNMSEEDIVAISWLNDKRLLFHQQNKGQESFGYYAIDADGKNLVILQQAVSLSGDGITNELENADSRRGFSIIDMLPNDPDHILVNEIRGASGLGDIYRVNVNTGRRYKVMNNLGKVREWITDRAGVVRLALSNDERGEDVEILYRKDASGEWVSLGIQKLDAPGWRPLGFDGDNKTLYVTSDLGRKTTAVYKYDFENKKLGELVFGDDTYDADSLLYSRHLNKVVGIAYDGEYPEIHWLDDTYKNLQASLDAILPGSRNRIATMTRDGSACIVTARSDREPGVYYYLDTRKNELALLGAMNEKISPGDMAPMKPVAFTARDGLLLHGYLTLPVGREPKNLPLIIHPHGGPYGPRDSWGFNHEVQFYANRGYAVLQVNYRGSGGYGRWFEEAGYRQWGLKMQDDLTDAVKWAVAQGYADPDRVGISGASYGGYAVLAGLVYTPELYKIGINYVGAVDIERLGPIRHFNKMKKSRQNYIARRWLHATLDSRQIKETSPINYIENIRVPTLHAYGKFDPRVTIDHGIVLRQKLDKHNKVYEYVEMGNEGHGFYKFENKINFFTKVDAFLKKYFPAGTIKNS